MTELGQYAQTHDRMDTSDRIRQMSTDELLTELDDVIQFDLLHLDNVEWTRLTSKNYHYLAILYTLRERLTD